MNMGLKARYLLRGEHNKKFSAVYINIMTTMFVHGLLNLRLLNWKNLWQTLFLYVKKVLESKKDELTGRLFFRHGVLRYLL